MPPYTMMPVRRSVVASAQLEERMGAEGASVARASIENVLFISNVQTALDFDFGGYMQAIEAIANGETTAVQALPELQEQISVP